MSVVDGRFRLDALLGEGAFGSAHLARDRDGRRVVVKLLHAGVARDPEVTERFRREVRALERLHHPNVVALVASGTCPARGPYYATAWCPGLPLDRVLERAGALPFARARRLVDQMLAAIEAAHALGIVHRDLKPANVLVEDPGTEFENVHVIDFGLAKHLEGGSTTVKDLTLGQAVGSPLSMSPEQCTGEHGTPKSDVYSVGCVLFLLLAGRPPFSAETVTGLMHKHVALFPPRLEDLVHGAPDELGDLVDACLAKTPDERPTATEMRARLAAVPDFLPPERPPRPRLGLPRSGAIVGGHLLGDELRRTERSAVFACPLRSGSGGALEVFGFPEGEDLRAEARFPAVIAEVRGIEDVPTIHHAEWGERFGYVLTALPEGVPFDRFLEEERPGLAALTPIFRGIGAALEAGHERGAVHGPLRADAVYVSPPGDVQLADWVLARLLVADDLAPSADARALARFVVETLAGPGAADAPSLEGLVEAPLAGPLRRCLDEAAQGKMVVRGVLEALEEARAPRPAARWKLEPASPERSPSRSVVFAFGGSRLRFGRDRSGAEGRWNDLILRCFAGPGEDPQVAVDRSRRISGHHGSFETTGVDVVVRDDGSTRGLFMGRARLAARRDYALPEVFELGVADALTLTGRVFRDARRRVSALRLERGRAAVPAHVYAWLVEGGTLGSGEDDALRLAVPGVQPGHARVALREGALVVARGSGPVSVAGRALGPDEPAVLEGPGEVVLGDVRLRCAPAGDEDMKRG